MNRLEDHIKERKDDSTNLVEWIQRTIQKGIMPEKEILQGIAVFLYTTNLYYKDLNVMVGSTTGKMKVLTEKEDEFENYRGLIAMTCESMNFLMQNPSYQYSQGTVFRGMYGFTR